MVNDNRPLSWLERARRVRGGEPNLAYRTPDISLTEFEDFVGALLRRSFDAVVLCTEGGLYLEVSDSFCALTGYTRDELLGHTSITRGLVDPNGVRRTATSDVRRKIPGLYQNTMSRKDGSSRDVEFSHQFLENGYTLVIIRDITEG